MIADHPVRHRQQPGLGHFGVRYLVEAPPGDGKNLGRGVLGVVRVESTQAVAKDIGMVPLEEFIETLLSIRVDGYDCPRRHSVKCPDAATADSGYDRRATEEEERP
jgi:hypothetical protein